MSVVGLLVWPCRDIDPHGPHDWTVHQGRITGPVHCPGRSVFGIPLPTEEASDA